MHPYIVEQLAADHQREMRQQADDHRRARRAKMTTTEPATHPTRRARPRRLVPLLIPRRRIVEPS